MTVTPSTLVARNSAVATSGIDLWEPTAIFLPDWSSPVRFDTSWRTTIQMARSGAEQRYGKTDKPYRSQRLRLRSIGDANTQRMRATLARLGRSRSPWPIFVDPAKLLGRLSPDANVYSVEDTSNRRFQVGARAVALIDGNCAIADDFQFRTIQAVTASQITLDGDLKETYTSSPFVRTHTSYLGPPPISPTNVLVAAEGNGLVSAQGDVLVGYVFGDINTAEPLYTLASIEVWVSGVGVVENIGLGDARVISNLSDDYTGISGGKVIAAVWWKVPQQYAGERVDFRFTYGVGEEAFDHLGGSIVAVQNTHQHDPVFHVQGVNNGDVTSDFITLSRDATTRMTDNLVLGFFSAGVNSDEFNSIGAGGTSLYERDLDDCELAAGWWLETDASPVNVAYSLNAGGEGENEGFAVATITFQQPEDKPDLSRGLIFPVMECDVETANAGNVLTDNINDITLEVMETPGLSALDPVASPNTIPAGFSTYDGYPIMHLPIDWRNVQMGTFRLGKQENVGITRTFTAFGTKPGETFNLPFRINGRSDIWNLLKFFDCRAARLHPFWLISPSSGMEVTAIGVGGDTLTLNANTTERDWEVYNYIGVMDKATGALSVHEITLSVEAAGNHILTIDPPLATEDPNDYAFATAHLCRFDTEELGETWITDEDMDVVLPVKELIEEKTVSVTLLDMCPGGGGGPGWVPDNDHDLCEDERCGQESGGCCMCAQFGVSMEIYCWFGECCPFVGCGSECQSGGSCQLWLTYVSCIGGVMRWEGPYNSWVTLDTSNVDWDFSYGDVFTEGNCCDGFDNPDVGDCAAQFCCIGQDDHCDEDFIITESCSGYRKEVPCTQYAPDGICQMVPSIVISTSGGAGSGSGLCA